MGLLTVNLSGGAHWATGNGGGGEIAFLGEKELQWKIINVR